jgi:hypothetical protein
MSIIFNFYKIKYLIFIKKVLFEILMTIMDIKKYSIILYNSLNYYKIKNKNGYIVIKISNKSICVFFCLIFFI